MKQLIRNYIIKQLWQFVAKVKKNDTPFVIGVTGSLGKTSTKEALVAVLSATKKRIVTSKASFNTEFGIPLTMLGYHQAPTGLGWLLVILRAWKRKSLGFKNYYLVLEYGADKPGDIQFLTKHLPVDIAVLTKIAGTHLANFKKIESVALEKLILAKSKSAKGWIIANADDPYQRLGLKGESRIIWYGIESRLATVKASQINISPNGTTFNLTLEKERREIQSLMLGKHQLYHLLAASALGSLQKVSISEIEKVLSTLQPKPGRLRMISGTRGTKILDDSYNSSPEAAMAALDVLKNIKNPGSAKSRRLAILGNMNELGEAEAKLHREVGKYVYGRADALVAIGANAHELAIGAKQAGLKPQNIITFETPESLLKRLDDVIQRNDVILVKASQHKMRFERIVKALMQNPEKAGKLLVRQSRYWQRR